MNVPPSSTVTLINALRFLALDIKSDDGIANAAIAEAADRLEQQATEIGLLKARLSSDAAIEKWKRDKAPSAPLPA